MLILLISNLILPIIFAYPTYDDCIFMKNYNLNSIFNDSYTQVAFLMDASYWEGKFARHMLGLNILSAVTYDGIFIDYNSGVGMPEHHHDFSAASKSIHLSLLALALNNNYYAINFFNSSAELWSGDVRSYIIDQLARKITSYENFNKTWPGFGGFLPWYNANDTGIYLMEEYWSQRVPSLDNGEMIWGMVAVYKKLVDIGQADLATRYKNYIDMLANNALIVFMDTTNNDTVFGIRTVSLINDTSAMPTPSNYGRDPGDNGLLNDPYEGELFLLFADLYSDWTNFGGQASKDRIWAGKQKNEYIRSLSTPKGQIIVEQGWEYSSHEKWKYMELPYFDSQIVNDVYLNGEKARTWFSYMNNYPGLFADVTNISVPNRNDTYNPAYIGQGITPLALSSSGNTIVTPYGSFPLLLHPATFSYGLAWYANMLNGSRMQGPQGSTESISLDGQYISPINTWDSKITTVLAFSGGIYDITREYLNQTGAYSRFYQLIDTLYSTTFSGILEGTSIDFQLPPVMYNRTISFSGCEGTTPSPATCSDMSSDCFSYLGFCSTPSYHKTMCAECKKSCNLCNDNTC